MSNQENRTKVLMVYPEFPDSFWSFKKCLPMINKRASMPPTGLATVAAMLPAQHFDILPIIDLNIRTLAYDDIEKADLVMFSTMIAQKDSLSEIIARIKSLGKPVAVGGPYATSYPDRIISMGADYLILNEAETTLRLFVEDWISDNLKQVYGELKGQKKPGIEKTPVPRFDLLEIHKYASMAIQFSRGCPYNCEFCDITSLYGRTPRVKTATQLLAELDAILKLGWRGPIFIVDDNFIGNRSAAREFLPLLIEWQRLNGYPFSFFTEASVDLANDELADIRENMVKAGFNEVFCGIESPDPDVLREMGKKQNRGDIAEKVKTIQKSGLEVTAGFIIGSDSDKENIFEAIFDFIQKNGIVMAMAGLLTALRGTLLYKRLEEDGRLIRESSGNNTHQLSLNFIPKISENVLISGYVKLLERLYSSKNYFARCRKLNNLIGSQRSVPINRHSIQAAVIIFYRNIFKRPDWEFIKFIFATLKNPHNIPLAIRQAVKLVHFQHITSDLAFEYDRKK